MSSMVNGAGWSLLAGLGLLMGDLSDPSIVGEGAPEITPEMLEAGFAVFKESGIVDDPLESDKELVRQIFLAMAHLHSA
jgi:hypothetical protein